MVLSKLLFRGKLKIVYALGILLFLTKLTYGQNDTSTAFRYYQVKSCKIAYKFFDGLHEGEKTVIFNDFGRYEKESINAPDLADSKVGDSIMLRFMTTKINRVMIRTPQFEYVIDLNGHKGVRRDRVISPFGPEYLDAEKKVVGMDTILGKPCEVDEFGGAIRVWYWNKIALKNELIGQVDGKAVGQYAIAIDQNYVVKTNEFAVPEGIVLIIAEQQ